MTKVKASKHLLIVGCHDGAAMFGLPLAPLFAPIFSHASF